MQIFPLKAYSFVLCAVLALFVAAPCDARDVLTNNYDNARTGANLSELTLNRKNVALKTFGRMFHLPVDGPVFAQPLVVSDFPMSNGDRRDLVLIATANNSVFAFDGRTHESRLIWQRELVYLPDGTRLPANGILSTPVIDRERGLIYVVAALATENGQRFLLHALMLADGTTANAPILIHGAVAVGANQIAFQPSAKRVAVQRAALAIAQDKLIVAFGGDYFEGWVFSFDMKNLAAPPAVFCTSCASRDVGLSKVDYLDEKCILLGPGGGIWQAGRGPVVDSAGKVYFFTGNKQHVVKAGCMIPFGNNACSSCSAKEGCLCKETRFSAVCRGPDVCEANQSEDYKTFDVNEALIQLDVKQRLKLTGWFRPINWNIAGPEGLELNDLDLGGSGPLLVPNTHRLIGGGKQGVMYVLEASNAEKSCDPTLAETCIQASAIQSFHIAPTPPRPNQYYRHILGGPVLWNRTAEQGGSRVYVWRVNDHLRSYRISDKFDECDLSDAGPSASHNCRSLAQSEDHIDHNPGGVLAISANESDTQSAIVWASTTRSINGPGKLMAFNAEPDVDTSAVLNKIWDSDICVEDRIDLGSDFVPPTVANGRVYVATNANRVEVFGLIVDKKCTEEALPKSFGPMLQ